MSKSDRHKRLIRLKKRIKGIVSQSDRDHPDFDGKCSVPNIWPLRTLVHADKQAALLACEVHDKRAMRIRGWCRTGWKCVPIVIEGVEGFDDYEYKEYTKPWRRDVKRANKEFFKNLRVGLGLFYAVIYYAGVANKLGRKSFTPAKGPMAELNKECWDNAMAKMEKINPGWLKKGDE